MIFGIPRCHTAFPGDVPQIHVTSPYFTPPVGVEGVTSPKFTRGGDVPETDNYQFTRVATSPKLTNTNKFRGRHFLNLRIT